MEKLDPSDILTVDMVEAAAESLQQYKIAPVICECCGKSLYRMRIHPYWLLPEHEDDLITLLEATGHHCSTEETS